MMRSLAIAGVLVLGMGQLLGQIPPGSPQEGAPVFRTVQPAFPPGEYNFTMEKN
jgi:hypothetical protein